MHPPDAAAWPVQVCVVHIQEEEREGTLPVSVMSHHPATRQTHRITCKQTIRSESQWAYYGMVPSGDLEKEMSSNAHTKYWWPTWPSLCVTEEKWGMEYVDCQQVHCPGCLMMGCSVVAPWGPGSLHDGSPTLLVFGVSDLWVKWPEMNPGRTFAQYIHLQPAWWTT